jgi:hypothetical protein
MLKYTSCLFATIVLHAYYARLETYHHLFLAVTILSILNHSAYDLLVNQIDRLLAHLGYFYILLETQHVLSHGALGLLCFPACVGALWAAEMKWETRQNELHMALHCVSAVGVHAYMYVLYESTA